MMQETLVDNLIWQREIPGKEIYFDTIRYFEEQLSLLKVEVHKNHKVGIEELRDVFADAVIFATGVTPKMPDIQGIDHFSVMDYETAINNKSTLKDKIAIIGAGGIGFDVAEMLMAKNEINDWYERWNIDKTFQQRGGVHGDATDNVESGREIYLLQRKDEKLGKNLARTTGWIKRLSLRKAGVNMISNVSYKNIDDAGLHIMSEGKEITLAVDHVVICAGQKSEDELYKQLGSLGQVVHVIGGAKKAAELDAETAIKEGLELAYRL